MSIKRILLTGARAPATLDLARIFAKNGYEVHAADSVACALTFSSKAVHSTHIVASPKMATARFMEQLMDIIKREQIDIIIPTCEEIFYLASYKKQIETYCQLFAEDIGRLAALHNKHQFPLIAEQYQLPVPSTTLCQNIDDWKSATSMMDKKIGKPVFSRFSNQLYFLPEDREKPIDISEQKQWVVQDYIDGEHYCSYSVAHNGRILAHIVYQSKFRVGDGATIHFQTIHEPSVDNWVKKFVESYQFTGQIGFDFIKDKAGTVYAIECNPRLTSGIHLFDRLPVHEAFLGTTTETITPQNSSRMLTAAMLTYALPNIKQHGMKQTMNAIAAANDIVWDWHDPAPFFKQMQSLLYFWQLSRGQKINLTEATTFDISWDG
ncbi:ATP-grasp domain-containing protein [Gracilibacillus oryzae]|uniref:ATP-grasp domain-containing protein n=1 Tax=Gracilibacillus oryzae TaxID=1672701 RepID=A0A7C8GS19_9BACI|nr:ATP-grasp domain-containing protein [Gracilibacillus oryzae]KAB8129181.1 ATP-grasp domain-containing protein [Gracilibacillus oryzae]